MKKIIIAIAALAFCIGAYAQPQPKRKPIVPSDDSAKLENLEEGLKENIKERYRLDEEEGWEKGFDLDVAFPMFFGWTYMMGGEYTGAWQAMSSDLVYGDFMDTQTKKNFSYAIDVARLNFTVSENLRFYAGVRYTSEQYSLTNRNVYFRNVSNTLTPTAIGEPVNYSKIGVRTWGVPVGLTIAAKKFTISANVAPEWTKRATCKYSGEVVEYMHKDLTGFSEFRLSYTVMAGFAGNGLFVRYSTTPIFEDGVGFDGATPLTFGLVIGI